jgi:hypothetical protein
MQRMVIHKDNVFETLVALGQDNSVIYSVVPVLCADQNLIAICYDSYADACKTVEKQENVTGIIH